MTEAKTAARKNKSADHLPEASQILEDFRICCISREASELSRNEVLSDRANFGIIGDGKEVAQVAMAHAWRKGDFRSGYYRDQTLLFALGVLSLEGFFAQLYGDPELDAASGGRQMNCHFSTPLIDAQGQWLKHKELFNISADISPTGGQMARALGLALASKKYREFPEIAADFSQNGNEVVFCTIGDASTSEGVFWETINAAGVMQVPLAVSVWDDGFGISVPQKFQTTKESISDVLAGFQPDERPGMDIYTGKAWDYPGLCALYGSAIEKMRHNHSPALFHIQETTQQLGHSTSGDHRRYKSPERLEWEKKYDCNVRMAEWLISEGLASPDEIAAIKAEAKKLVKETAARVYDHYFSQAGILKTELVALLGDLSAQHDDIRSALAQLEGHRRPMRHEVLKIARQCLFLLPESHSQSKQALQHWIERVAREGQDIYNRYLYSETPHAALNVAVEPAVYSEGAPLTDGHKVLNACFDYNFEHNPRLFAFGEDVGQIGDVNQGFANLQKKHGIGRIFDTGIREWTIMGQAIGMAMRGQRPIAEIQYLDYVYYALSALTDDLACLRWRTNNQQMAPAIIRTRGHRLVGVWHAGSQMGLLLSSLRGMYICVPRNMVQAAGMYNTLLRSDDPAIVIECLNGYRLKELLPDNIGTFTVPLGKPEILQEGSDATVVTYGSCVRIAMEASELLKKRGISIEIVDIQTLLPFDLDQTCLKSLKKTNRIVFFDEDMPGGASAFMMREVLEVQGGYRYLDAAPATLTAQPTRPGYGKDGDYFNKPQAEDLYETVFNMVREGEPGRF